MGRRLLLLSSLVLLLSLSSCSKKPEQASLTMPTYPNASLTKHITPEDGKSDEMYLESTDDGKRIIDHYVDTLKRDGWKVTTNNALGVMSMVAAEKDSLIMGVRVFERNGRRVIHQSIKRQRKWFRL
jgi:hypothetical protein